MLIVLEMNIKNITEFITFRCSLDNQGKHTLLIHINYLDVFSNNSGLKKTNTYKDLEGEKQPKRAKSCLSKLDQLKSI